MQFKRPIDDLIDNKDYLIKYLILDYDDCSHGSPGVKESGEIKLSGKNVRDFWFSLKKIGSQDYFNLLARFNYVQNNRELEVAVILTASSKDLLNKYFKNENLTRLT